MCICIYIYICIYTYNQVHMIRCNHDLKVALLKEVWDDCVKEEMTKNKKSEEEATKSVKLVWLLGMLCLKLDLTSTVCYFCRAGGEVTAFIVWSERRLLACQFDEKISRGDSCQMSWD